MDHYKFRAIAYDRYKDFETPNLHKTSSFYQRKLSKYLKLENDANYLDIACGYGNFLAFLQNKNIKKFIGIDSSKHCVKSVEEIFGAEHVLHSDVFDFLDKHEGQFDFISALDFIEHLNKNELFNLLLMVNKSQPNKGKLLIRTPNAAGIFGMAARYADITHEICFTPDSLADVLARFGYRVEKVWEDSPAPGSLLQTIHWISWSMVRFIIRILNAAEAGIWGDGIVSRNMWLLAQKIE